MNEPYLWDRSGPPDADIQKLEETLSALRHRREFKSPVRPRATWWPSAIAAALLIGAAAWLVSSQPAARQSAWQVAKFEGSVSLNGRAASASAPLFTGQTLRTGPASSVTLAAGDFGELNIAPDSELRVLQSAADSQRLRLDRGVLHAFIWAPPKQFVVDTPAARAIDIGCEYTLSVDRDGNGAIRVQMGWVAFQHGNRESFIPAGATCTTNVRRGPGVPVFEDASEAFRYSVDAYNRTSDSSELDQMLVLARPRDGLTLWHLLSRVPAAERGKVFDRFVQLIPLPSQVTREGIIALHPAMMDLCWNALNLESTEWWRGWKRPWQPE
jgi:ferric-dicitrate binding protein FerR (iron transport regulator)